MSTNRANILRRVRIALVEAKNEIDLAREQSTKPKHLSVRIRRAAAQAARAVVSAVDAGFDEIWSIGWWILWSLRKPDDPKRPPAIFSMGGKKVELPSIQFGSGCHSDGSLPDDTALALWIQFICPVLRSERFVFKGGAGAFDHPKTKTDPKGHLLSRTGKRLRRIKIKNSSGRTVGWQLEGPPACESDGYDESDWLAYLQCQAADWSDACAAAIELASAEVAVSTSAAADNQAGPKCQVKPVQVSEDESAAMITVSDLAERFDLEREPLRQRLNRWRRRHAGGTDWVEVSERKPREEKYLYRLGAVLPELVKASGEPSSERPAK